MVPPSRNLTSSMTTAGTPATTAQQRITPKPANIKFRISSNLNSSIPSLEADPAKISPPYNYRTQNNSPASLRRAVDTYYEDANRALAKAQHYFRTQTNSPVDQDEDDPLESAHRLSHSLSYY